MRVIVRAVGRDLDSVRKSASYIARGTDWHTEPGPLGTGIAFCFANENTRIMFLAHSIKFNILFSREP